MASIVYPGNRTLTRGYDDAGRLVSSTDWNAKETTFGYDEDSNLTTVDFPTGDQTDSTSYDRADRITGIEMTAGATTLAALDYTRDDHGQLTGEDLTDLPGVDRTWDYDTLERLTTQNTATAWAYDDADNLTRTTTDGTTIQAFNPAGQLCTAAPTAGTCAAPATGATGYGYDTRGNRTTVTPPSPAPVTTLGYDQANRLTVVNTANATYGYNPDGLRTSKTVSSATTGFAWDKTGGLPLLLTETTGTSTTSYLYGPGGTPYAQIAPDGTTTTYLHADQLGSTRLLTDATGTPTGAATYDAYGTVTAGTGTLSPFGYAGQYTDAETGYQYLRARYYDPATGQFLTRDPITPLTREPYAYVGGRPLSFGDASGLTSVPGPGIPSPSDLWHGAVDPLWEAYDSFMDTDLGGYDWGGTAAAAVNVTYGGFKVLTGFPLIFAPAGATVAGPPLGLVTWPVALLGAYNVVTGSARFDRGVQQAGAVASGCTIEQGPEGQTVRDNLDRFAAGVLPGGDSLWDLLGGLP